MPGSGFLSQSEAGAGGARTNGSEGRAAAERREEQAPSPDSTQTRDPGEGTFSEKREKKRRKLRGFNRVFYSEECQLSLRESSYSSQGGFAWHQPGFDNQTNV